MPNACNSAEDYERFKNYIEDKLNGLGISKANIVVTFPYESESSLSIGGWVTLILIGIIIILGLIGILTEYAPIFSSQEASLSPKIEDKLSFPGRIFLCFSFKNNFMKLFKISKSEEEDLKIFNGVRVICLSWIVLGHCFIELLGSPIINAITSLDILTEWHATFIPAAFLSVDVFFMMAGFLSFYLLTNKMYSKGFINYPLVVIHRFLRLLIPLGF